LKTFDVGRSMVIHVYGSFFGLSASFVLSRIAKPEKGTETTYGNIIFSIIGTLFLWMFWPFSNAAYAPAN
jgi:ammonium transporter Rh